MNSLNSYSSQGLQSRFGGRLKGHLNRRLIAVMVGALVLGSTATADVLAKQPHFSPPAPVSIHIHGQGHGRGHAHAPAYRAPKPSYRFRANDRVRLQRQYRRSLPLVRIDRRPRFSVGYAIPAVYRPHITVIPQDIRRQLPPPPRGYRMGYYQGYSVVYDPVTFTILSVLDLLTN